MFGIAINKLFEWLFSRVLSSHCEGPGLIPSQDMSVLEPLVKDKDDLGLVSSQRYKLSAMERVFMFILKFFSFFILQTCLSLEGGGGHCVLMYFCIRPKDMSAQTYFPSKLACIKKFQGTNSIETSGYQYTI
jgi:hypothetical protein